MATTGVESIFVDTNVLVFANVAEAPLHKVALAKLQEYQESGCQIWISAQVLREYMSVRSRLENAKRSMQPATLVDRVRFFESAFNVAYETQNTLDRLLMLVKKVEVGGKQIHDANIVATMLERGIKHLLTDNIEDFRRFEPYITVLPVRS
jgi:predicted nucleic acid-binding protein